MGWMRQVEIQSIHFEPFKSDWKEGREKKRWIGCKNIRPKESKNFFSGWIRRKRKASFFLSFSLSILFLFPNPL